MSIEDQADRGPERQAEIVAFLAAPATYGLADAAVERRSTHISELFLTPRHAYKMKRAVRLPFVDFSGLEQRRAACARELEVNRLTAPALYEALVPVRRDANGGLHLGGGDARGEVVEWLVRMRRFDDGELLDRLACRGDISEALAEAVADAVWDLHARAPVHPEAAAADDLAAVIEENAEELVAAAGLLGEERVCGLTAAIAATLAVQRPLLTRRAGEGRVRRGHGDLHLRNIVRLEGRPVLFDALEFDEGLAITDTGYDLAFLLMDLLHREMKSQANLVLNRYLARSGDLGLLPALPLFVAVRACVRAKILAGLGEGAEAVAYLDLATRALTAPALPLLTAVGGPSGSGKSTLARALAPALPGILGAVWLRSDAIRKRLAGVAPECRLPPERYSQAASDAVYAEMMDEAAAALHAGLPVVVDAVFGRSGEQQAIAALAGHCDSRFLGLWLTAPREDLLRRVCRRTGDASDADARVVRLQLERIEPPGDWLTLDAGEPPMSRALQAVEKLFNSS